MDPFTQRMLERARARQEKIDQKLANSGQTVPNRKPLSENIINKNQSSPIKSPLKSSKQAYSSPKKISGDPTKPVKTDECIQKMRNDIVVTKREFKSPNRGSLTRRNSDVSVEINISHKNDIQIEVQVEERDAPISIIYNPSTESGSNVIISEIEDDTSSAIEKDAGTTETKTEKCGLRNNFKSRLDRLGNLYSNKPLSSPIHRTEQDFSAATPPLVKEPPKPKADNKRKFGRLAALADQINNWEDDLSHPTLQPETKPVKSTIATKNEKLDASTLDISVHSMKDITKVLQTATNKSSKNTKPVNAHTFIKPSVNECQRLGKEIVAELEGEGYRRVSATQSRLVYDFAPNKHDTDRQDARSATATPGAVATPSMAAAVAHTPQTGAVSKRPSIKKYRAPTPPNKLDEICDSEKDKENEIDVVVENGANDSKQTKPDERPAAEGSPAARRLTPRATNVDRSSVLSKAAMFEAGSPRSKEKDPAEMSLRERKALFEKNKGAAIVPRAPFGMAPSVKALHGDTKDKPALKPVVQARTPTKSASEKNSRTNSKDSLTEGDNTSHSSVGGGIKGKLAALFNKEQTISETTIANKFKLEREREMEMLQNRFHYKKPHKGEDNDTDSDDQSENDPSEKAPLMGSTTSLALANRKPEIIAHIPKVVTEHRATKEERDIEQDKSAMTHPAKRRSSQDSQVVLSVVDEVKRIKVNGATKEGVVVQQPTSIYPHLSDIETDTSAAHDEYSDCGGSSVENIPMKLNKSDNWAETSFGREVMNVVKKNNSSYKKAVQSDSDESGSACDSELDDLLDEALEEGPTPPKVNKHSSQSSSSFVYQERGQFKSPLKVQGGGPAGRGDRGAELVHSVSFYRRAQASSAPSTPLRVVRHASPEREPATPDEPAPSVTTVRQRIKELQNEINKQQTVISQASQALNLCAATIEFSGSTEQAEGERLLLLATHRRQACVHEVQRLQVEGAGPAAAAGMASLHLSGLRIPLRRDYVRQLHADGAVGHYAVCLLKCRDRVLATSMQLTTPAPLHFPDEVRMDGLASDFKVTVEVYLLQASKEVLPHDVKYHINNKKSSSKLLTPKSKVSELKAPRIQSPAGPGAVRSPQFQLHGYCIFALQQASRKTFTLNKVPHGSPLEGSVSMEIVARVRVPPPAPHAAFLTAFDDVSGLGAWHRRWFRLQPPRLAYWKYPDDVHKKMPIGDIDLTTVVSDKVVRAPRDLCARPNTLLLETAVPAGLSVDAGDGASLVYVRGEDGRVRRRHLLAADTPQDRDVWLQRLNAALEFVRCLPADEDL